MPLNVAVTLASKTSLSLNWEDSLILFYFNYTATVTIEQGEETVFTLSQPSLLLDLEGWECEPFHIAISMPGNCKPTVVEGSLLVGKISILFSN